MWRVEDGTFVPIPTLPVDNTLNIFVEVAMANNVDGDDVPMPTFTLNHAAPDAGKVVVPTASCPVMRVEEERVLVD